MLWRKARQPLTTKPVRLAVLGSSTLTHLLPAIRVAGLRRGIWIDTYETDYGQYWQELSDPESALHAFRPTAVLLALDAYDLDRRCHRRHGCQDAAEAALAEITDADPATWRQARETFRCPVLQQAALPVHLPLLGNNEHRLAGSRAAFLTRLNARLRTMAEEEGVDILAIDDRAARDGIAPGTIRVCGTAPNRKSATPPHRCMAIWSADGSRPDRGGRSSAWCSTSTTRSGAASSATTAWKASRSDRAAPLGEAYVAFQDYARELSRRGIILAVCSKNDEANALEPFEQHPDMVLRRGDIASFVANWSDKAATSARSPRN